MPDLHPDVVRAIRSLSGTKLGRRFDRYARREYGIPGWKLAGKQLAGEGGGTTKNPKTSYAGARGPAQFMPATRTEMIRRHGVDPYRSDKEAVQGLMHYDLERGVAGYNPGMPSYTNYVLGQKLNRADRRALRGGGVPGQPINPDVKTTDVSLEKRTVPGQSFATERSDARKQLLLGGELNFNTLLQYKRTVNSLSDIPSSTETGDIQVERRKFKRVESGGGGPAGALPNTGRSLDEMFRIAEDVDRINNKGKLPYSWGGGHGAKPAGVGTPVDCSGFVSQILGVAPRVSGQFAASWGNPGPGKWVTVYADQGHVLIRMKDPQSGKQRWFGTSRSNPGGGAGEIAPPTREYLSRFTKRHPGKR